MKVSIDISRGTWWSKDLNFGQQIGGLVWPIMERYQRLRFQYTWITSVVGQDRTQLLIRF